MQQACCIFFEMDARDADALCLAFELNREITIPAQRNIVLRDLVALHQIGIRVVLAVELRVLRNRTVEGQGCHNRISDSLLIDYGQYTRHPHTDGAYVRIWRNQGKVRAKTKKKFAFRQKPAVHFKSDEKLKISNN